MWACECGGVQARVIGWGGRGACTLMPQPRLHEVMGRDGWAALLPATCMLLPAHLRLPWHTTAPSGGHQHQRQPAHAGHGGVTPSGGAEGRLHPLPQQQTDPPAAAVPGGECTHGHRGGHEPQPCARRGNLQHAAVCAEGHGRHEPGTGQGTGQHVSSRVVGGGQ